MKNSITYDTCMPAVRGSSGSHWTALRKLNVALGYSADVVKMILISVPGYDDPQVARHVVPTLTQPLEETVVTVRQMVARIQDVLALTSAQVAQVVGVSRPALYKHLNGESVRDIQAYMRVYRIACQVESEIDGLDKRHKTVLVDGRTLPRHLADRSINARQFIDLVARVNTKVESMKAGPEAKAPSESQQRLASRSVTRAG